MCALVTGVQTCALPISLACAVFFEGHAVTIEQPPHGALRHLHPVLPLQVPDDLRKRDVALSFDQPQGLRSVSLEVVRAVISALRAAQGRPSAPTDRPT